MVCDSQQGPCTQNSSLARSTLGCCFLSEPGFCLGSAGLAARLGARGSEEDLLLRFIPCCLSPSGCSCSTALCSISSSAFTRSCSQGDRNDANPPCWGLDKTHPPNRSRAPSPSAGPTTARPLHRTPPQRGTPSCCTRPCPRGKHKSCSSVRSGLTWRYLFLQHGPSPAQRAPGSACTRGRWHSAVRGSRPTRHAGSPCQS